MKNLKKIIYYITIVIILIGLIILAMKRCLNTSFWLDELSSVGFISKHQSFGNIFKIFTTYEIYNLPLYSIFLFFSYRIFKYTEFSLLLPGILFSLIGLFFLTKIILNFFGKKVSVLILILICSSGLFINTIFWEVRCYGLLFMLSSIFVFYYIKRLENENLKNIIILGLIGLLLAFTHWFGGLLLLMYFLTDVYLLLKKRICITCFLSYIIIATFFLPWIILIIINHTADISTFWINVPKIINIVTYSNYLFGIGNGNNDIQISNIFFSGLFLLAIFLVLKFDKKKINNKLNINYNNIVIFFSLLFIIYIYSAYINPNAPIFYPKYFIVLLPHGYFILATLLSKIFNAKICFNYSFALVITILITYLLLTNDIPFFNWDTDYNKLAQILTENNDITNSDCVIINNTLSFYSGFMEFYFENKNRPVPNKNVNYITQEELITYNTVYYIYDHVGDYDLFDYDIVDFLNNNYKLINYDANIHVYKYAK